MPTDFIHLHVHSRHSFLDGLCDPTKLAQRCRRLGMSACAVTDHDHMGGALRHYRACKKAGVRPILGMEVTIGQGHLVLLAENLEGYHNLMALSGRPDLQFSHVAEHSTGLIALTACVRGHVPAALRRREDDRARAFLRHLTKVFGHDNLFVELQFNAGPHPTLNRRLCDLAREFDLGVVATNDVHYVEPHEADDQNALMAIRQAGNKSVFRHPAPEYYLKSPREMFEATRGYNKAFDNALVIGDRCRVELELDKPDLPKFADDEERMLSQMARQGFLDRGFGQGEAAMRLTRELSVIQSMGFAGYFLIVQDFVNEARRRGVAVGPGRGSGAGSLVAYCLRITDLDPLRHGLFFERFLNPERVSMPDFDIDFEQEGRDRVIDYVKERYDHVAQIATYMTLGPKAAIKDVARVMGLPFVEVNDYTKVIPSSIRPRDDEEKALHPLDLALKFAPDLVARAQRDGEYGRLIATARNLTGCVRQTGKHAGGVVIGRLPIDHYTPLTEEGLTAYDKKDVEAAGLVKFDFLGVKTLDVIARAREAAGVGVIPEDPEVFRSLGTGDTWGTFQLESPGMTGVCKRLDPRCLEDIIALVALYRPGPKESGMLDDYIERHHGRQRVTYPHPLLEPVLKATHGTLIYQEQVMKAAQVLAGYTLGGADILRRAMGKKDDKEMASQRRVFVDGCLKNGIDEDVAVEIFGAIEKHSGYSFNLSHSAGYAVLANQTAWLKYHHLPEFVASLLTVECGDRLTLARYVRESRRKGLTILCPDVNASGHGFRVEGQGIRWGLKAIRDLGDGARVVADNQPYEDFYDLALKTRLQAAGLRALVDAGACDGFGLPRHILRATCRLAADERRRRELDERRGQDLMFDDVERRYEEAEDDGRGLEREFESLGVYVSGHPATGSWYAIVDVHRKISRAGNPWARVVIERPDFKWASVLFFSRALEKYDPQVGQLVRVVGRRNDDGDLVVDKMSVRTLTDDPESNIVVGTGGES